MRRASSAMIFCARGPGIALFNVGPNWESVASLAMRVVFEVSRAAGLMGLSLKFGSGDWIRFGRPCMRYDVTRRAFRDKEERGSLKVISFADWRMGIALVA